MVKKLLMILILGCAWMVECSIPRRPESHKKSKTLMRKLSQEQFDELIRAINGDNLELIEEVISREADRDKWKVIAVREAVNLSKLDLVQKLLDRGYPVFFDKEQGFVQPLKMAIQKLDVPMVKLIMEYDTHVDYCHDQDSYLHTIARLGNNEGAVEILDLLLQKNANIYRKNKRDQTMIDLICKLQSEPMFNKLCEYHPLVSQELTDSRLSSSDSSDTPRGVKTPKSQSPRENGTKHKKIELMEDQGISLISALSYVSLGVMSSMAGLGLWAMLFKRNTRADDKP